MSVKSRCRRLQRQGGSMFVRMAVALSTSLLPLRTRTPARGWTILSGGGRSASRIRCFGSQGATKALETALFDAHCHLQLPRLLPVADDVIAHARRVGVMGVAVCGCWPDDWIDVQRLAASYADFVAPQFGVHPWWAIEHACGAAAAPPSRKISTEDAYTAQTIDWLEDLQQLLIQYPCAGVGECGLDGVRRKQLALNAQVAVLEPQLALARDLARPVSLHCVRAHGMLFEVLRRVFGDRGHQPGIVLHSYCGSPDMVKPFSKLNCFFSFSASFAHIPKHAEALREVPRERLLLETDSPDQIPREIACALQADIRRQGRERQRGKCCVHEILEELGSLAGSPCYTSIQRSLHSHVLLRYFLEWCSWALYLRHGCAAVAQDKIAISHLQEPALLAGICTKAAAVRGERAQELGAVTTANAQRVFMRA